MMGVMKVVGVLFLLWVVWCWLVVSSMWFSRCFELLGVLLLRVLLLVLLVLLGGLVMISYCICCSVLLLNMVWWCCLYSL